MSIKDEWRRLADKVKAWWEEFLRAQIIDDDPHDAEGGASPWSETWKAPSWPAVSKASCWEGASAQIRHMNILSPHISDGKCLERLNWAAHRGCNSVHVFVSNQGDGEGSGYSIYGTGEPTPGTVDSKSVSRMKERIELAHERGLAVALWLLADDSSRWNKILLKNPVAYAMDLEKSGLLAVADLVVLGLELDEYASESQVAALEKAVRSVWNGTVGTHHTSGKAPFAKHGDVVFWQVNPGKNQAQIVSEVQKAKNAMGKPVNMFEIARNPQRELCEAALNAGAVGVGNW